MSENMRVVRCITPEELEEARKIDTIAFRARHDYKKDKDKVKTTEDLTNDADDIANYRVSFINGKMTACMLALPYTMRFDGHEVPMIGIGGVASLPEYRRTGGVRDIFAELFLEMWENGVVFSVLYPFSPAFYRQFGYEMGHVLKRTTIPVKAFAGFRSEGQFAQYMPGESDGEIRAIYAKYIERENLNQAIIRSNKMWRRLLNHDPYATGRHTYIWYDESGAARGYIHFLDNLDGKRTMRVYDLAFDGREGLYGILSLLRSMSAAYEHIEFECPMHIPIENIIPDTYDVQWNVSYCGQVRVIDVRKALTLMSKPAGTGRFTVSVTDPMLSGNNGLFTVEYDDNGTRVDFKEAAVGGDLDVSISALSQLIIGCTDLHGALLTRRDVKVTGNKELLSKIFTNRPQHLTEKF